MSDDREAITEMYAAAERHHRYEVEQKVESKLHQAFELLNSAAPGWHNDDKRFCMRKKLRRIAYKKIDAVVKGRVADEMRNLVKNVAIMRLTQERKDAKTTYSPES